MRYSILFLVLLFLLIVNTTNAQILSTNSTAGEQNTFYTNESVYAMSNSNMTVNGTTVRIYIVLNNDNWSNGTTLTDISGGYKTATTNDTGYLANTKIWSPALAIGSYDIIADTNSDGKYETALDFVDNLTATGFSVIAVPKPTITASIGENSPPNHNWNLDVDGNANNLMLQLELSAGSVEDVNIKDIFIQAKGSGNDKTGINSVALMQDKNNNGIFDPNEDILGLDAFDKDNGAIDFVLNNFILRTNSSANFIFIYKMSNSSSNGDTFSFQLVSVNAEGINSKDAADMNGLPMDSSTATIIANPTTTTIASNATTTAITTTTQLQTTTTLPQETSNFIDTVLDFLKTNWIFILILIAIPIALVIVISRLLRRKSNIAYEELKQKWSK